MTDSSGSQNMVSFGNENDLETRDIPTATEEKLEYGPTTSHPTPLSTFPEGGWRAWSVVLGVYVYFHLSLRRFAE